MESELGLRLGLREPGPRALENLPEPEPIPEYKEGETFEEALKRFIMTCAAHRKEHYERMRAGSTEPGELFGSQWQLGTSPGGRRYIRIVEGLRGGAVYCFVEKGTGHVLKSAGWKTPAKHVRGSIFAKEFAGYGVTQYGAQYLR